MESSLPGTLSLSVFDAATTLGEAVATTVHQTLMQAVRERGHATLAVGGGPFARRCLPLLAALDLPWKRVLVTLCDELDVPPGHLDSHERQVRELLLRGRAAGAHFLPLRFAVDEATTLAQAERALQAVSAPFDLVLLGVGADSSVAALVPGAPGMTAALDPRGAARCCVLRPLPAAGVPLPARLGLTMSALLDSRRILLIGQGLPQRDAFERAVLGHWPEPSPLHALAQHASQPIGFYWCR